MKKISLFLLVVMLFVFVASCDRNDEFPVDDETDQIEAQDPVTVGDGAVMVKTIYTTDDVVIADVVATEEPYNADPTGKTDATDAIQKALYAVEDLGGGVVFLPAGDYLVTDTIYVPSGVILQGDWQDPISTSEPEYGTIIIAKPNALVPSQVKNRAAEPLFNIESGCGLVGLTFYYPEQTIEDPIPYGYTIYSEAPRIAALRNITMVNSYRGIGIGTKLASTHELIQNENLRICALDTALEMYRSSEVGNTVNVVVSPAFWINAGRDFKCSDPEALRAYCKENTLGFVFNDLDDEHFSSLYFESCRTAIYLPETPNVSQGYWGVIYDVDIVDCMYGIVAEEVCPSLGTAIANARIDADLKAIVNSSDMGTIKLCGIELTGEGTVCAEGGRIMWDKESDISDYEIKYGSYKKPASYLYNAQVKDLSGKLEDAAPIIQEALDVAAETGGVVYIPAGVYSIYTTLRVPENVQLRGSSPVFIRDSASGDPDGTVLMSYVTDGSCIELSAGAGVYGLRIFCPVYDVFKAHEMLKNNDSMTETNIGIRGLGSGVYTYNVGITSTFIGIDFSDCDDHLIKQTFGCTYNTFAKVGGKNGVVESCLCNPHFVNRQIYAEKGYCNPEYADVNSWLNCSNQNEAGMGGSAGFALIRDEILRDYCTMIEVVNATEESIHNVFMYAPYELIKTTNSSASIINTSADFVGMGSVYSITNNSKVSIVNALRSAGDSIICDETVTVDFYNRINTVIPYEGNFHTSRSYVDEYEYTVIDRISVGDEESPASEAGSSVNTDPTYIKDGSYSHKHDPQRTNQTEVIYYREFEEIDISQFINENGYLHMWVWIEEMGTHLWGGAIEISNGNPENQARYWVPTSCITHQGWNELWLPLESAFERGGYSGQRVNCIRIYTESSVFLEQEITYFDDVYFCTAESDTVRYCIEQSTVTEETNPTAPMVTVKPKIDESFEYIYVSDCEDNSNAAENITLYVNDDPAYVKQGEHSLMSKDGERKNVDVFAFKFDDGNSLDISEIMNTGYLHFWLYVEDVETFTNGQLELTSSGTNNKQKIIWLPNQYISRQGWNEVWVPLSETQVGSLDQFDPTRLNFIRLWMSTKDRTYGNYYIDDIYFCNSIVSDSDLGYKIGDLNKSGDLIVDTCDTLENVAVSGVRLIKESEMVKEGKGSWRIVGGSQEIIKYRYSENINVSQYENGYLHIWIWVDDVSKLREGQIEITSSGDCDRNELNWSVTQYITVSGWNELYLPLAEAGISGGEFDSEAFNYIRMYIFTHDGQSIMFYFDDFRFTNTK